MLECLSKVADPRRRQGRRYQLEYILMFSVLAMLCGATSYRKIQRCMNAHRERLNAWFGLAWKRAPAHTSIRSLLQALDPQELEQAFRIHSQQLLDSRADADTPILRKNRITNVSEALYDNALCLDNLLDYAGIFQN